MEPELFKSFFEMADAILAHVGATGQRVLSWDDPMHLQIGFSADSGSVMWGITLVKLKAAFKDSRLSVEQQARFGDLVRSTEGREQLAAGFSRGVRLWEEAA